MKTVITPDGQVLQVPDDSDPKEPSSSEPKPKSKEAERSARRREAQKNQQPDKSDSDISEAAEKISTERKKEKRKDPTKDEIKGVADALTMLFALGVNTAGVIAARDLVKYGFRPPGIDAAKAETVGVAWAPILAPYILPWMKNVQLVGAIMVTVAVTQDHMTQVEKSAVDFVKRRQNA